LTDPIDKREQKAQAKADKARAKAMRPWYAKKRIILPAALVLVIGISTAMNSGGGNTSQDASSDQSQTTDTTVEYANETVSQQNARESAESYLSFSGFSREGLIKQLEFEEYSNEDATYAVDILNVDWNEQAKRSAESYLDTMAFSRTGLISQLEFEGYTTEEATFGVDAQNADWMEQAAKKAAEYLDSSSFSRQGLIDQLEFEGFTEEEAVFGVDSVGL
jgi:hypothetical protein